MYHKYRVYYRQYPGEKVLSVVVKATLKEQAIRVATRQLWRKSISCYPTGYVTLVGKPNKPF